MSKIRYNIATDRKIDFVKFGFVSGVITVIAVLFVMIGIGNLWSSDKRVQEQKKKLEQDRLKLEDLSNKTELYKKNVTAKKRGWQTRVTFSNSLISEKISYITDKLEVLEKHLPEGVFITNVSLQGGPKTNIHFKVAAESLSKLTETYENFNSYNHAIKNEVEDNGLFKAEIILIMGK